MNRISRVAIAAALVSAAAIVAAPRTMAADPVADFYRNKTVTVFTSFQATGGFGLYAKLVADFIGRHLPGHPRAIPEYMGGAGGVKGANYFYTVAPKDGTVIGMLSQVAPLFQRLKGEAGGFRYDTGRMTWLGRLTTMEAVMGTRTASGLTSLDALKGRELIACASGKSHQGYINSRAFAEMMGLKMKVITGYPGTADQLLAVARDECNVLIMSWDTWKTRGQTPIQDKSVALLAVVGLERSVDLPDVPTMAELAPDADTREVQKFIASYAGIGRAFALPPGVPADRVAAMKQAFEAMYKDPDFVAAAKKQHMDLVTAPGETVRKYVMDTLNAPDDVVAKTRAMVGM